MLKSKKRKKGIIAVLFLSLVLFLIPVNAFAATAAQSSGEKVSLQAESRYVEYIVTFNNLELPPSTYYYNIGGWKGTLTRQAYWFYETTGITKARYGGTVTCLGGCVY
jgi:hypothetical protein